MPSTKSRRKTRKTTARPPAKRPTKRPAKRKATSAPNEWFALRRSRIQGRGAFARKDIPKGTRIIEYTGEKISNAESDRRYPDDDRDARHHTFLFTLNSRTIVDAAVDGNEARFINHSCQPNCDAVIERGHIWIESIKDIRKGEELVYDYQYEWDSAYTRDDLQFYKCECGSPNCRGTIVKAPKNKLRQFGFLKE